MRRLLLAASLVALWAAPASARLETGSKAFPESWVLAEALAELGRSAGAEVRHRNNLGGTEIVFGALEAGEIDFYPDYTGTVSEVILKSKDDLSLAQMRARLAERGIGITDPLGFNNTYAIAVRRDTYESLGLRTIGDLAKHPELRLAFGHEFLGRPDGWPGLSAHYGIEMPNIRGLEHALCYAAIAEGAVDVIDVYTTDAEVLGLDLVYLEDDRGFFPRYDAVVLYRLDVPAREPAAWEAITRIVGHVDETRMIRANARVVVDGQTYRQAADSLLVDALDREVSRVSTEPGMAGRILADTLQHLRLVAVSLLAAILIGVPLGILATRSRWLAGVTLAAAGLLQTIPSLALLAFLIPLLGIGVVPAMVALFLYSLLPIVRNTYMGLTTIPTPLTEAAAVLGLSSAAQLLRVRLPMAAPAVMTGIKTSAVINVGTATLAALIGAGGLGEPILAGIQLRRHDLILQGAIPAAVLALLVQWVFDALDRLAVPRGLRLDSEGS